MFSSYIMLYGMYNKGSAASRLLTLSGPFKVPISSPSFHFDRMFNVAGMPLECAHAILGLPLHVIQLSNIIPSHPPCSLILHAAQLYPLPSDHFLPLRSNLPRTLTSLPISLYPASNHRHSGRNIFCGRQPRSSASSHRLPLHVGRSWRRQYYCTRDCDCVRSFVL